MSYPYFSDLVEAATGFALPLPLPMFGLFVALAVVVSSACLRRELHRLYKAGAIGAATMRARRNADTGVALAVPPQDIVSDLALTVTLAGIVGARLFHILEHLDLFVVDPWSMIFNRSGLSVFGGLIVGMIAGLIQVRRWKLPLRPLLDAVAPALMLGYGIGRIGCQVAGDGDWGVVSNMAIKPDWLPAWFWAQTYDHNIFGVLIQAPGVYPTPLYETMMALACFALLWSLRKHRFQAGWLFSIYLLLAGAERFLIEQIRVNPVLQFGSVHATQAELIAVTLFACGLIGMVLCGRRAPSGRSRVAIRHDAAR